MTALVMGILNVTPDSFSDGGRFSDPDKAIARGLEMAEQGASIVDVGGESTRPGAAPVPLDEELSRVIPVVEGLAGRVEISIDTRHAEVAEAAVRAGASIINDVSASLEEVAARTGAGWVAMHMQGEPGTMQSEPHYGDVVAEVSQYLFDRAMRAQRLGVSRVFIDPGIGFGKTLEHNLELLRRLEVLTGSEWPVVTGTSRKSFLGKLAHGADTGDRLEGSIASAIWASTHGAAMVRVHDVLETVRALDVVAAIDNEKQGRISSGNENEDQ